MVTICQIGSLKQGQTSCQIGSLEPIFQAQADGEHVYVIGLNRVYHRVASVQVVA